MAPARAAYSHSASVKSRYSFWVNCDSQATYCLASLQLTLITGIRPRPQWSGTRGHRTAATQASHSSKLTSNLDTANGSATETSRWGPSLASRSGSSSGEPIVNLPAGMTIMTGQPVAHSLNSEPGSAALAFSCSTVSTVVLDATI